MSGPQNHSAQIDENGRLRHFLTTHQLDPSMILQILRTTDSFFNLKNEIVTDLKIMAGKTVTNLFFEPSTRTQTSFDIAARNLGAKVINLNIGHSSVKKGESILDTARTIQAMHSNIFVVRDNYAGTAHLLAQHLPQKTTIINAGDGRHAHPTQAMLDVYTIQREKNDFSKLKVAIIGDILHSRVARSLIHTLSALKTKKIVVIGPRTLLPSKLDALGVKVETDMEKGIKKADVLIMLRLQKERMEGLLIPSEQEYYALYGLTRRKLALANSEAIVLHPGPINRGLEISSNVADGPQSRILKQLHYGVAVRMSILKTLMESK